MHELLATMSQAGGSDLFIAALAEAAAKAS
jgi:hypothetical protein